MDNYLLSDKDRETLQSKVTTKLREVILKGEFKMGERLVQEEWAAKLGVSRMPIRDALRQLEVEGLVRIEPRRGTIVTPISPEDIEEIYQLRALLEGEAVERSLPYLEEEDIVELESLYSRMVSLSNTDDDIEEYMRLNKKFHALLRQGCPWRRIHQMIDSLWQGIPLYTPSLFPNDLEEGHQEHKQILDFIKQNEPKKVRGILEKHILRTRDNVLSVMKQTDKEK